MGWMAALMLGWEVSAAAAGTNATGKVAGIAAGRAEKEIIRKQVLTGSHIPTVARRIGNTADTPYPIYILDTREIGQSGASSVAEVLRRCPAIR